MTLLIPNRFPNRNTIADRAAALGIRLSHDQLVEVTGQMKALADQGQLSAGQVEVLLLKHAAVADAV